MDLQTLKFTVVDDELDTNAHLISKHHHEHIERESRLFETGSTFDMWMFNNLVNFDEEKNEPIVKILDRYDRMLSGSNFGDTLEENIYVYSLDGEYKKENNNLYFNPNFDINNTIIYNRSTSKGADIFKGIYIEGHDISEDIESVNIISGGDLLYKLGKEDFVTTLVGGQKVLKIANLGIPVLKERFHELLLNIEHKCENKLPIKFVAIGINDENLINRIKFRPFELLLHKHSLICFHSGLMGRTIIHDCEISEKYKEYYKSVEEETKNRINFKAK